MSFKLREPVNGLTHLLGIPLSITALILLVYFAVQHATAAHIVAFSIYGTSLVLLYTASTLYHLLPLAKKGVKFLRRIDHMMIYVLIAGTYTPLCLIALRGVWGYTMLVVIWVIAAVGIVLKVVWFNAPRWLSALSYLLMGWLVAITIPQLIQTVSPGGLAWLAAGGILYTVGAILYATKWPKLPLKHFDFHAVFHIFILLGSFSHFILMFRYIMLIR